MAELDPETNTLRSSATKVLRKRYMWLLGIVGLPGIGDLVREYVRGQAMDYAVSKLGWFGDFIVANPVALTSIGVVAALIVLTVMVVSESSKETPSPIYEHRDKRFTRPPAPKRWIVGFAITMMVIIAVISFGTYKYWLHTSRRSDTRISVNTSAKAPSVLMQPDGEPKRDAPTKIDHSKEPIASRKGRPLAFGESHTKPQQRVQHPEQAVQQQQPIQPLPSAVPQTWGQRIADKYKRTGDANKSRVSTALYEFHEMLKRGNDVWGKVNHEAGKLGGDVGSGEIATNYKSHLDTLHDLSRDAGGFRKDYETVRARWDNYEDLESCVFGDNENEGPIALMNAVDGYAASLSNWSVIQNKDAKPTQTLLGDAHNSFNERSTQFAHWRQDSEKHIREIQDALQ